MRLASWNINSLRHRLRSVGTFCRKERPDVLCLQETKVEDALFPRQALARLGFEHIVFSGQKAYHGVAIASRIPIASHFCRDIGRTGEPRHICAALDNGIEVHNIYVPAGGDDPNPDRNPKFARKLAFIRAATRWMRSWHEQPRLVVGDFNVAPLETDVWSHKMLKRNITHTPIEIEHLDKWQRSGAFVDVAREFVPPEEKLFTWWSYRAPNFRTANKGRRLDHIWAAPCLQSSLKSFRVADEVRGWKTPSDHAPLVCELALA